MITISGTSGLTSGSTVKATLADARLPAGSTASISTDIAVDETTSGAMKVAVYGTAGSIDSSPLKRKITESIATLSITSAATAISSPEVKTVPDAGNVTVIAGGSTSLRIVSV